MMKKSDGWDHFITMGRITWDFRRSSEQDWGSRCIYLPGMRNITRLLIERNSWDYFDVGVPYPTGFHPNSPSDVATWQEFVRTRVARIASITCDLECEVTNKEIKREVWDCGSDKSPGPDGFTFEFFKKYWSTVGVDVINVVKEFFSPSNFPNGCNSSFIALIPKVLGAKQVNDFRPISLIGCQYKIIGKILANRLSLVIDGIISQEQSTFIKGRQIMDGPLILNEVISWCKSKKVQALLFKVDFQKAFDSVRWDHIDDILYKLGFGFKWRGWIRGCVFSSKASVLVNGVTPPKIR
ncbi:RNA-directed DNA polymerase, eukaryota [Tanacetum coccineum]